MPGGWEDAPCGLLTLRLDGLIVEVNHMFLSWVGRNSEDVLGKLRLSELLSVGGRIYWETHVAPLLRLEGRVDEVSLELSAPNGKLPVLLTAVIASSAEGVDVIRVAISSARERWRYERDLLAARKSAEQSEARVRLLQVTTAGLAQALGVSAVADVLVASSLGPMGAASATVWLADPDRGLVVHATGGNPRSDDFLPAALSSQTVAVQTGAGVAVPLRGRTSLQGVLCVTADDAAGAEALDLEVLTAIGQQAGLALDRAQLYDESANVAHQLQQSLLAVEPPADARFTVATTYRPGVEALEVGGDWYDVFLAAGDLLSVCVGDVVGRGLAAAGAMGQLRSAVRALADAEIGPAQLVSRLDNFVEQVEPARMATVLYAELDLTGGTLRYACAGHPPPLLLSVSAEPRFLWDGRSAPLGAYVETHRRTEGQTKLQPGDRLLVYTDGLVERRDRGIDEGLDLLVSAAKDLDQLPLDELVPTITEMMLKDELVRDDVCVLLLAWSGTG